MRFDSLDDIGAFCRDLTIGDARAADAAKSLQLGWCAALACHIGMPTFSEAGVSDAGA